MNKSKLITMLAACGTAFAAQSASAQSVVNISGATLLQNFLESQAMTNDFFDADGNGDSLQTNLALQQLAPGGLPPLPPFDPPFTGDQVWMVTYRSVGSVNGLQELFDFGQTYVTSADGIDLFSSVAQKATLDRAAYVSGGVPVGASNTNNPGAAPIRSTMPGGFLASPTATYNGGGAASGGVRIDIAPVDVPTIWAIQSPTPGTPDFALPPGIDGYGRNPVTTVNFDGSPNTFDHLLADPGGLNIAVLSAPNFDDNTVFDTTLTISPVAFLTNLGTGITEMFKSEVRHVFATGRRENGENLMVHTRDSGSGTRNAFNNGICLDPSWGIGENVGNQSVGSDLRRVGPLYTPSNKGGSSEMEGTLRNHRLGVGYSGAERGIGKWLDGGELEIIGIWSDLIGENGTEFARPSIVNCLDGSSETGYTIAARSIMASIGDPQNENAPGGTPGNTNPAMRNAAAAALLNNITLSVDAFNAVPNALEITFSPAEFLASRFIPFAAPDNVPSEQSACIQLTNTAQVAAVRAEVLSLSKLGDIGYDAPFFYTMNGKVPDRYQDGSTTYSDEYLPQVTNGGNYVTQGGTVLSDLTDLLGWDGTPTTPNRNMIAGDFNGDGLRNCDDAADMMLAWAERDSQGGTVWTAPNGTGPLLNTLGADACIEILGDFNGDGSFTAEDVRYWADGLAINTTSGKVNRKEGFTKVDTEFAGNFFNTSLANPSATYDAGDSRADVSNANGWTTPNFTPSAGADGTVDCYDLDYIFKQFINNPRVLDGQLNWDTTSEAINGDFSCDINGDCVIDMNDINETLAILETVLGDVNLDGTVDAADLAIATPNFGLPGGWCDGDMNGDGIVDQADLDIINGAMPGCDGDANGDGSVDVNDISFVLFRLGQNNGVCGDGDANGDGVNDVNDISYVLFRLGTCNPGGPC